jgi:hypothetical protein
LPIVGVPRDGLFVSQNEAPKFKHGLEWAQTNIDARDPAALGRWWLEALGWVVVNDDPEEFEIRPAEGRFFGLPSLSSRR